MKLFEFENYKEYVRKRTKNMPHGGRGEYLKLGKFLGVNSVVVSQIFKGQRNLTDEHAYLITKYFGFNELETEYFMLLVDLEKSAHFEHKKYLKQKIANIQKESQETKNIIANKELSEEAKSIFYANWYYSAVRLAVSLPGCHSVDAISEKLNLSKARVQKITEFLLSHGLIMEEKGLLKRGPSRTLLGADSPYVSRYHASWRSKAIQNMDELEDHEKFFTFPMSISKDTLQLFKKKITDLIAELNKDLGQSKVDRLGCLNIDLFELKK